MVFAVYTVDMVICFEFSLQLWCLYMIEKLLYCLFVCIYNVRVQSSVLAQILHKILHPIKSSNFAISYYVRISMTKYNHSHILPTPFLQILLSFSDAGYITLRVAANRLSVFMEDPLLQTSLRGLSLCTDIRTVRIFILINMSSVRT